MGFLDSILKSAVKRVVNEVVDEAKEKVFGDNQPATTPVNSTPVNTAPPVKRTVVVNKPDLSGEIHEDIFYSLGKDAEVKLSFELPPNFFVGDCGAAEIPVYLQMNDYGNDVYDPSVFTSTPFIAIGDDELQEDDMRGVSNLIESDVVGHPVLKKKYEYKLHEERTAHSAEMNYDCILYKFYLDESEEGKYEYTMLTLRVPSHCGRDTYEYAVKALELVAATLKIEPYEE